MQKNLLFILLIAVLSACGSQKTNLKPTEENLKSTVKYLASDALQGRKTGTEGIDKAGDYLMGHLKKYGIGPYFEDYRDQFSLSGVQGANIVGYIPGSDPELKDQFVVLGAHYDHIGMIPKRAVAGDSLANGANDNASGVATVLEIARILSQKDLKRSVLITFFAGEEEGLLGSKHLAKRLSKQNFNLYVMLNFEMLGIPMETEYMAYITGFKRSNLAKKFNAYAGKKVLGHFQKATELNLFKRSDNYAFYKQFKEPAQTMSSYNFKNSPYYHHVDDEIKTLNFDFMKNFIGASLPSIIQIINSPEGAIKMKTN